MALAVLQFFFLLTLNLSQSRVLLERRARLYSRCFLGVRVLHSHVIHDWVYRVEVNWFDTNLSITDDGHVISSQVHRSLEVCCQN